MLARLERVERHFRFQVHANDAVSDWYAVAVDPPPVLVPLDGRPSPQVRLQYPAYTDRPAQDLPDGTGNVEAVTGTGVHFRAAADRPLARAWVEFDPELKPVTFTAALGVLAADNPAAVLTLSAAGREAALRIPARLSADRRVLSVSFLPRFRGAYILRFEDDTGLGNSRAFDLRLLLDPPPLVNLERPSPTKDSLFVLPSADVPVQVSAEDQQFAVRSVYLSCRCKNSAGDIEPAQRRPLYDHRNTGRTLAATLAAFAGPLPAPVPPRLRPQLIQVRQVLSLARLRHADGKALQEGDSVTLQAAADDFDDVAVDKPPGLSHEVEIHLVSRAVLEAILNREQTQIQEELLRLRKDQQEALQRVIGAEQRWRNAGRLRPQDIEQLLQAEQLQQQIRARIGTKQEGLRSAVERVQNTLRNNRLPRSGAHDRMETIAGELDRLTREELDEIEPRLTNARKESETATPTAPPPKDRKGQLGEARAHQEEVENTLNELLKLLEPWGNLSAVQGEARSILQEQRKLNEEVKDAARQGVEGRNREELTQEQKAALGRGAELQRKLAERADQLLDKMERAIPDRQEKDPAMADALRGAVEQAQKDALRENLKNAAESIRANNLGRADQNQRAAVQTLEAMVRSLDERREQELDRLRKKLHQAAQKLDDLSRRQQLLRKKAKDAARLSDPKKREQELKRLAREQEQLRKETQDLVRELTRLRADQASQALSGAGSNMDQSGQQLQRGQDSDDAQEEALDRLNEARRRVGQAQAQVEDELARERLAKVADQLKQLKERQESLAAEAERIHQGVLEKNGWDRGSKINLSKLAEAQRALGEETNSLAKGRLAPAKVFARTLERSAEAMQQAADEMVRQVERANENAESTDFSAAITRQQRAAMSRIDPLLDALKTDRGLARAPAPEGDGGGQGGAGGQGGGPGGGRPDDGIPQLAQLKVLRTLQQQINERTDTFGKRHPNADALTPAQLAELQALQKEQQEIADFLEELTAPPAPEGGKP
jgi:hypothetical protein